MQNDIIPVSVRLKDFRVKRQKTYGECIVNIRALFGAFGRVVFSVIFSGIFYVGWMAVGIVEFRSGLNSTILRTIIWIAAPIVTAFGFAIGVFLFERLPGTRKSKFLDIYKWSFAGCAIGAASVVWFGPMLIVFGMFALGTAAIAIREILIIRKAGKDVTRS